MLYHRNEFAFVRLPARGTLSSSSSSPSREIALLSSLFLVVSSSFRHPRRHQRFVMQTRVTRLGSPDRLLRSLCIFCRLCSHPRCVAAISAMTKTNILSATRLSPLSCTCIRVYPSSLYIFCISPKRARPCTSEPARFLRENRLHNILLRDRDRRVRDRCTAALIEVGRR